ncbi:Antitoxin Xre (plasmid) [Pararobbsia alpina]|uniref:type II RES/Xre toxin-antitoxin system antitoxin n=1 Tax=Pararobbsia alpina TaxID=621374 RepID=UPI0039A5F564
MVVFVPSGAAAPVSAEFGLLAALLAAPVRSGFDLATLARERIDIAVLDRLIQRGLRADELAFIIPRRTLAHRRQHDERLTLEESDRAIRLARIIAQAIATFDDNDKAMGWLRAPKKRFGGASGLDMAGTEHGARLVEEALVQLEEGYFA